MKQQWRSRKESDSKKTARPKWQVLCCMEDNDCHLNLAARIPLVVIRLETK